MGQRHQIYVALPPCYLCGGTGKRNDQYVKDRCNGCSGKGHRRGKVVGIHHQWLYGRGPLRKLGLLLSLIRNGADDFGPFHPKCLDEPSHMLKAAYEVDHEDGGYHFCHILEHGETEDPNLGDNNDGITVVDLRTYDGTKQGRIGYCFMRLFEDDSTLRSGAPAYTPLTAKQYVRAYYPGGKPETDDERQLEKLVRRVIRQVEKWRPVLLTREEVQAIFPKMKMDSAVSAGA